MTNSANLLHNDIKQNETTESTRTKTKRINWKNVNAMEVCVRPTINLPVNKLSMNKMSDIIFPTTFFPALQIHNYTRTRVCVCVCVCVCCVFAVWFESILHFCFNRTYAHNFYSIFLFLTLSFIRAIPSFSIIVQCAMRAISDSLRLLPKAEWNVHNRSKSAIAIALAMTRM